MMKEERHDRSVASTRAVGDEEARGHGGSFSSATLRHNAEHACELPSRHCSDATGIWSAGGGYSPPAWPARATNGRIGLRV
jgi:hypothetical protein